MIYHLYNNIKKNEKKNILDIDTAALIPNPYLGGRIMSYQVLNRCITTFRNSSDNDSLY